MSAPISTLPTGDATRRPKAPGVVVLTLTTALAVLVAVIGITSRAAPPPTVAQFAPQAVQQIKQAPDQQNSQFGEGQGVDGVGNDGGSGPGGSGTTVPPVVTTLAPAPPGAPPVTRRCIGNPPRQIEDSQSPPCVPFFEGDNGGATSKGVTRDTIRIAIPLWSDEVPLMQNFFNRRFEFYGRKLELINPEVGNSADPAVERTDAAKVDSLNVFASGGYSYNMYYSEELAKRKVISVTSEPYYTEENLRELDPYVWQYEASLDKMFDTIGAWACRRLAKKPAIHAGDAPTRTKERAFGIVGFQHFPERRYSFSPLERRLEGCGSKSKILIDQTNLGNAATPTEAQNEVLQLKDAGVTSVICTCEYIQLGMLMNAATQQNYFPEWIGGSFIFNDEDATLHLNSGGQQLDNLFGLTFQPREMRQESQAATWAVKEGSGQPDTPQTALNLRGRRQNYHDLLMLASGIQMAGPNLTPETFKAALQRTVFPNPKDGLNQGDVDFRGDHSMTEDVTEYYWSSIGISPYISSPPGAVCYLDLGARYKATTFPASDPDVEKVPCESRDI